jgi:hypothetical protein
VLTAGSQTDSESSTLISAADATADLQRAVPYEFSHSVKLQYCLSDRANTGEDMGNLSHNAKQSAVECLAESCMLFHHRLWINPKDHSNLYIERKPR